MKKVRCAVIGAGWWGTTAHVPALKDHPGAELVAVHHHEADQAARIARDNGIPACYDSVDSLLAAGGIDAVVISSIPVLHYEHAHGALSRGLHVLLEKPMCITAAEAADLVDLANKQGVEFTISAPWHFTSHGRAARELIQSGRLGPVKMISVLMTNFTRGLYEGLPWSEVFGRSPTLQNSAEPYLKPGQTSYSDPAIAGGGQIYCQVSHAAAYLTYLTGSQPAEVFARFADLGGAVDIYDTLNIKLANGAIVSLASTGATMLSRRQYEVRVFGTDGMVLLELWEGKMEVHALDCNITRMPDLSEDEIYPLYAPTRNFIDAIRGVAPNESPATLGLAAMRITDGAVRSMRANSNIVL